MLSARNNSKTSTLPFSERKHGSCFLSEEEKASILKDKDNLILQDFIRSLRVRVFQRVDNDDFLGNKLDNQWWYAAFEYISDAAMLFTLYREEDVGKWLKDIVLTIIRRSEDVWIGPWFRDHNKPMTGHLETAHLNWAVSVAVDLAPDIFSIVEQEEIKKAIWEKGVIPCQRWIANHHHLANWRGIMLSGIIIPAAVFNEQKTLTTYIPAISQCLEAFQQDGSYAESLQYGNYLAFSLMLTYESLHRIHKVYAERIRIDAYAIGINWVTSSMFYTKPLMGLGIEPRARAANFNDSAAIFRPSGDLLLHIASRCKESLPEQAALAKWLFEEYYEGVSDQKPHNLASFGFVNDWGFLTFPLLQQAAASISPEKAHLPLTSSYSNGNSFIRDSWNAKSIIAIQGGAEPLNGPGHLHGDINSFILVHNKERLLIDPGHSCYRNLIHGLESASQTHNTCTFLLGSQINLQEELAKYKTLEQSNIPERRKINGGFLTDAIIRGNRQLITKRLEDVSVVGSEAAKLYGEPIQEFSRFWISAGSNVLFVVDRIKATEPIMTTWNWLVNNRDGNASVTYVNAQLLKVLRPQAGLLMFHGEKSEPRGPIYAYVHDFYHPESGQTGEGKPGSGLLYRWNEKKATEFRIMVHVLCFDEVAQLSSWKIEQEGNIFKVTSNEQKWSMEIQSEDHLQLSLTAQNKQWQLKEKNNLFRFSML